MLLSAMKLLSRSAILVGVFLEENGAASSQDIAKSLGMPLRTVQRALEDMRAMGTCDLPDGRIKVKPSRVKRVLDIAGRRSRPGVDIAESIMKMRREDPSHYRALISRPQMLRRSQKNGWTCSVTVSEIESLLRSALVCPCCGVTLDHSYNRGKNRRRSPSFDRFDNRIGYIPGNVVVICNRCNQLKRDAEPEELSQVAAWVSGGGK